MKVNLLTLLLILGTLVTAVTTTAQTGNRFPAPLGIDRVITGVVEKANNAAPNSSARHARFQLKSGETIYALHGEESILKKLVGKQVRITGHVVGNDVEVRSVDTSIKKD